jgi:hypothetical protein
MRYICPQGCVEERGMTKGHPGECPEGHGRFRYEKELQRGKPLSRVSPKRAEKVRRQGSTVNRSRGFAVHPSQRAKVKGRPCVNCGAGPYEGATIDPAHLIPRHWVSCDHPDGVIPLCRKCHDEYDVPSGGLDLLSRLEERGFHKEMAHFIGEHQVNPLTLLRYVTGVEYVPKSESPEKEGAR